MTVHPAKTFLRWQFAVLGLFISLTVLKETLDLPHLLFNDPPINGVLRLGEIFLESLIATLAVGLEIKIVQTLRQRIEVLEGIIPICSCCKSVRDESGRWLRIEAYIGHRSSVQFTHGYCPPCLTKVMADLENIAPVHLPHSKPTVLPYV